MTGEIKGRSALRNSLGAFLSFNLLGLIGFVAAVGIVVAPATSVAAEIGEIAVPLVAITVGFILAVGFITAWFIWLTGPYLLKLGVLNRSEIVFKVFFTGEKPQAGSRLG